MTYLLGIDVGTTGTKTLLIQDDGKVVASASEEYPLHTPQPNWSEQDPADWWRAVCGSVRAVLDKVPGAATHIAGIGLSGQMHGAVFLDQDHQVIRPAILWNDQRTGEECVEITSRVGAARLMELACNPALTGFTAPKILWLRTHEPKHYERVRTILLPKDYVRFRLTGTFATEVSDASGTLLFDVKGRRWSKELLELLEIPREFLPDCAESQEVTGKVSRIAAEETGLREGTPVVGGGGDQAAGAVGTGVVSKGIISSTLGTSGVVFAFADKPEMDPQGRLHTFCHAVPGKWHMMGVMLSAGGSLRWFRDVLCHEEVAQAQQQGVEVYELLTAAAATVSPGAEGLIFLPYLAGERTPYPDPQARGVFIGLSLRHTKAHLVRAVLEGVTFGMRDSLEIMREQHIEARQIRASGGGGRSDIWRQIQADVFAAPVTSINVQEGPAFGVALLAGVGTGVYSSVPEACQATIRVVSETAPRPEVTAVYERYYHIYRSLYPLLRETFARLGELVQG